MGVQELGERMMGYADLEGRAARGTMQRAVLVFMTALVVAGLAGCRTHEAAYSTVKGHVVVDPSERHPIRVSQKNKNAYFVVRRGQQGLSKYEQERLRQVVRRYQKNGTGKLFIKAPAGAPNEVAVRHALADFRKVMKKEQLPLKAVSFRTFVPDGDPEAPITVSYKGYVAKGPECGIWTEDLARSWKNLPYANFGCAQQHNLVALVANPRDLVTPRGMGQRSGERRDVLWRNYVLGEDTTSESSRQQKKGSSDEGYLGKKD